MIDNNLRWILISLAISLCILSLIHSINLFVEFILILISISIAIYVYYKEKIDKKEDHRKNQIEILKSLIYDMNQNQGHIKGLAEKFVKIIVKVKYGLIEKFDTPFDDKMERCISAMEKCYKNKKDLNYFINIKEFYNIITLGFKEKKVHSSIQDLLPAVFESYNFQSRVLHYVIQNFRQFNFKEFSELRDKFLRLRHIYDVYITNVSFAYNDSEDPYKRIELFDSKKSKIYDGKIYPASQYLEKYNVALNNMFFFIYEFSYYTKRLLIELLKNDEIKTFFSEEEIEKNLFYLHEIYSKFDISNKN